MKKYVLISCTGLCRFLLLHPARFGYAGGRQTAQEPGVRKIGPYRTANEHAPAEPEPIAVSPKVDAPEEPVESEPWVDVDGSLDVYSDEELRNMASTSPEAAVTLARRTVLDKDEAERWYERAVVLSSKPGPLIEWMLHQNIEGIDENSGVLDGDAIAVYPSLLLLDVEHAKVAYEISLIAEMLGFEQGVVVEKYEKGLTKEGVDLEPIRKQAEARFAQMTADRMELLSAPWEFAAPKE